jgi:hypothetical protein
MISALNVSTPIGVAPVPDQAKENIEKFYSAIEDGNFDTAFRLIHPARLDEIRAVKPNFSRDQFKELYASTREYKNRFVSRLHSLFETDSRVYSVSFDVSDEVPRNRLYESRQALVKDVAQTGILNIEPLLSSVINNLKESYDLPPNIEPVVRDDVLSRQFESVFDPLFLSEIRRNLSEEYQVRMTLRRTRPSTMLVWRHFLQNIEMLKDDQSWKVRQGIAQPRAVANYLPPAAP